MKKFRITIGKKSYDVTVEVLDDGAPQTGRPTVVAAAASQRSEASAPSPAAPTAGAGAVASPMAGVINAIQVKAGDEVQAGQVLVVLEAMKMENQITAPRTGAVKQVDVKVGDSVVEGQALLVLE